ncbi:MAG TPA: hypothetical protein VGF82_04375 [Terracidiphilus sp.]
MSIEHAPRSAFVTGLMRVVSAETLFLVGTWPGPCMSRTAQGQHEAAKSFNDLEFADGTAARRYTQDFAADCPVDGEKLNSCHV